MAKSVRDPSESHLEELIHEEQFAALLSKHGAGFFRLCNFLAQGDGAGWSKKHFFQAITEANELETFLDDFGARYNKSFSFFTELVASLRGFALAGHSLKHLQSRYEKYGLGENTEEQKAFLSDLTDALRFIAASICALAAESGREAMQRGVVIPQEKLADGKLPENVTKKRLSRNVDEEEILNEEHKVAEVTSKFLRAVEMIEGLKVKRIQDPERRRSYIERHCSEDRARVYEATVHNLQSKYDTYIKNTSIEKRDSRLSVLRGHISAALHLLESATHLVHFYERHENDIRSEKTKSQIAGVIDKNAVLEKVLNFALFHADRVLRGGKPIAEALLPHYTKQQTVEVTVPEGRYLHARPASLIVAIVNHYGVPVEMEIEGSKCNAASIMQVMVLAGTHPGVRKLQFHGDQNPLRDIRALFEAGLGEKSLDDLPEKLSYLRGGSA